jgi:hypothetical protein
MSNKLITAILLIFCFLVPFIVVTAFTDLVCRTSGYYAQGIQDERELENGQW